MSQIAQPKSAKHKRERAADFKKAKLKLGKGKQVAQNATNTSIASKGIALPSQSLSTAGSKGSEPTSRRNLTAQELLIQCRHYSTPVKKQALQETLDLVSDHPYLIQKHLLPLTTALAHLVADPSAGVRSLVRHLVRKTADTLPRASFVQVCAPPIVLFTLAALSSLEDPIRIDALQLVDTLLACIPDELVRGFDPAYIATHLQHSSSSEEGRTGARILDSLLSLLKVRNNAPSTSSGMTSAKAATISDLSPEARLAVLSTLETFLAAAAAATGDAHPRQEEDGNTAWYLAGAFSTQEAFRDFLASHGARGASTSTTTRAMPIERYASLESPHENERFAIESLGLFTPPTSPTPTTSTSANPASLLALLHPTLLSSFLDSAPTALNPSTATASEGNSGENQHLATVTAVVAVARQLFTLELGGASNANTTAKQRSEARKMLLAFLTHASPYFPFGADALAATPTGASKRPSMAQQAEELKFLSLNLAFAELSSLLVLSGAQGKGDFLVAEEMDRSRKGKGKSRKEVDAERVEEVVLELVQEWVVQALRGELTTPSSPMGTTLSPSSFHSLTPTLWALLNQSDSTRSSEVFGAVVDYFTRQNTNATSDGRAGEGKRRAGEFIARCVLFHSSPSYTAPFDLSALASKLPSTLSPNAKDTKQNALARWLVALPKYLWELGGNGATSSSPREREIELVLSVLLELVQQGDKGLISRATLESLSPLLIPFFHLVHPKTRAPHPGPFTRLPSTSPGARQALDLVWYLARPYAERNASPEATNENVQGLVDAVERACAVVGGEAAERWRALRVTV
ncbi:hypothetical protein JCM10908_002216 [Rhodotorula pacifica]|uniref:Ipi1p n=1 Tax=Rhodotorula pacifica TaxID=1495444 RepID=UPI003178E4C9